jgi:hypothetical protein
MKDEFFAPFFVMEVLDVDISYSRQKMLMQTQKVFITNKYSFTYKLNFKEHFFPEEILVLRLLMFHNLIEFPNESFLHSKLT